MPKKTKKEKILARQRRQISPSFVSESSSTPATNQAVTSTFQFRTPVTLHKQKNNLADDMAELAIIKHDLIKTLFLAITAIAIELSVYWLLNVKH